MDMPVTPVIVVVTAGAVVIGAPLDDLVTSINAVDTAPLAAVAGVVKAVTGVVDAKIGSHDSRRAGSTAAMARCTATSTTRWNSPGCWGSRDDEPPWGYPGNGGTQPGFL